MAASTVEEKENGTIEEKRKEIQSDVQAVVDVESDQDANSDALVIA